MIAVVKLGINDLWKLGEMENGYLHVELLLLQT